MNRPSPPLRTPPPLRRRPPVDDSGPLPQFSLGGEDDDFVPTQKRSVPLLEAAVSDADATWKRPAIGRAHADMVGAFLGLALPPLDDVSARFAYEVEITEVPPSSASPMPLVAKSSDADRTLKREKPISFPPVAIDPHPSLARPSANETVAGYQASLDKPKFRGWMIAAAMFVIGIAAFAVVTRADASSATTHTMGLDVGKPAPKLQLPPVESIAPAPAPAAKVEEKSEAPKAAQPKLGLVRTTANSAGHRIYVDFKVVGQGPSPFWWSCGPHVIKIGSAGPPQSVIIPCGGEVLVPMK